MNINATVAGYSGQKKSTLTFECSKCHHKETYTIDDVRSYGKNEPEPATCWKCGGSCFISSYRTVKR